MQAPPPSPFHQVRLLLERLRSNHVEIMSGVAIQAVRELLSCRHTSIIYAHALSTPRLAATQADVQDSAGV